MNDRSKFYARQIKLVGTEGQKKINQAKVLVIGAGGLGCPVLLYLAAMGVGEIGIVDHDKVDITNLHRQILYTPKDIGEYKAQMAAQKIIEQNPYIKVSFFLQKLSLENASSIIKPYEIVVDCTDNFATKFLVHDTCFFQNKKLVQASIYQYEGHLHCFDFSNDRETCLVPCLRCLWTKEPDDGCIGTCADVGIIGATAGVLGSLQTIEISKLILGKDHLKNGEGLFVDLIVQDYEKRRWKKNKECLLCGEKTQTTSINSNENLIGYKLDLKNLNDDLIWVDLRSEEERKYFFIDRPHLIYMPFADFSFARFDSKKKYLLICQKGFRSHQLARVSREFGYENFFSLENGMENFM